jgi:hypothetical protein
MRAVSVLPLLIVLGISTSALAQPAATNSSPQIAALEQEMSNAVHQVEKIVNQPVRAYRRTPQIHNVSTYSPGWFHEGATKPDFNTVDIRSTRETPFDTKPYVTSDLNPGLVFIGRELEFNAMTKYFYTNRALPKKKLTEVEMVEINRLYRIIGKCEAQLAKIEHPEGVHTGSAIALADEDASLSKRSKLLQPTIGVPLLCGAVAILVFIVWRRSG